VFNGPAPTIEPLIDQDEETETVGRLISDRITDFVQLHEIGGLCARGLSFAARLAAKQAAESAS